MVFVLEYHKGPSLDILLVVDFFFIEMVLEDILVIFLDAVFLILVDGVGGMKLAFWCLIDLDKACILV